MSHSNLSTIIKSDCLSIASELSKNQRDWSWQISPWILLMIKEILQDHWHIRVSFIPRQLNKSAYWVARAASPSTLPSD
ncbi:hypothetical protein LINPERHAP1_LOCUS35834 [Linum perenne]